MSTAGSHPPKLFGLECLRGPGGPCSQIKGIPDARTTSRTAVAPPPPLPAPLSPRGWNTQSPGFSRGWEWGGLGGGQLSNPCQARHAFIFRRPLLEWKGSLSGRRGHRRAQVQGRLIDTPVLCLWGPGPTHTTQPCEQPEDGGLG